MGTALELQTLGEIFSTTLTACSLNSLHSSGSRPGEAKLVRRGGYVSKVDAMDAAEAGEGEGCALNALQKQKPTATEQGQLQVEMKHTAAKKIQSRARGNKARATVATTRSARKKATLRIQKEYILGRKPDLPEETAQQLKEAFPGNVEMLRKVDLAMEQTPPLKVLNFGHCVVGPESAQLLAKALRRCSNLAVLDLGSCYVGCEGVGHLASSLKWVQSLKRLALPWNSIADEGAEELAKAIPSMEKLRDVDLSYNRISDGGAEHLAEALRATPTLRSLQLQANRMSPSGAKMLDSARRQWIKVNLDANNYVDTCTWNTSGSESAVPRAQSSQSKRQVPGAHRTPSRQDLPAPTPSLTRPPRSHTGR